MNVHAPRKPHHRNDEQPGDTDPALLPVDPDQGPVPPVIPNDPEHDPFVDPEA